MPRPLSDAELRTVAPSVFTSLAAASPAERGRLVLALVEASPDGQLRLEASNGAHADLSGLDLSPQALGARNALRSPHPSWWNAERETARLARAHLGGADLSGANLRMADLTGARLRGATLKDAGLGGARLGEADLEQSTLENADLVGADLRKAALSGANLENALLEEIDARGAAMRFSRLDGAALDDATLDGADLWGAHLDGATLVGASLVGTRLHEASLAGADLRNANLAGADLRDADLAGANLSGANLRETQLSGTNLAGANLQGARLQDLDLTASTLQNIHLHGAWMERTRLDRHQLGEKVGEELADDYEGAAGAYLTLERNFEQFGYAEAASWAYRRRRRMQKQHARLRAEVAAKAHRWKRAARHYLDFARDQFVEWLCDYGESVPRALGSVLLIYLTFTVIYGLTGSIVRVEDGSVVHLATLSDVQDAAIFSLISMTSAEGPAVGLEPRNQAVHVLTGIQTLLSIALTGLLGFVIGNRIRR